MGARADEVTPIVRAATVFDPPGELPSMLFVAGGFDSIGGVPAQSVAAWNGATYTPVGTGLFGNVYALCVFDDGSGPALYAGGSVVVPGDNEVVAVARWDGSQWSKVRSVRGIFYDFEVFDDGSGPALYACGHITYIDDQFAHSTVVRWSGGSWTLVGNSVDMRRTYDLEVHDAGEGPALFAGTEYGVYQWRDGLWQVVGNLVTNARAVKSFDNGSGSALYASWFYFSRWEGVMWEHVDTDFPRPNLAVVHGPSGSMLVALGTFSTIGGVPASNVAWWDGQAWHPFGSGLTKEVGHALGWQAATFDDGRGPALYVVGEFDAAGGVPTPSVARWACPDACLADCDLSGILDLFDFLCFSNQFVAHDQAADCDQNGEFDLFDFLCFVNSFNAGC